MPRCFHGLINPRVLCPSSFELAMASSSSRGSNSSSSSSFTKEVSKRVPVDGWDIFLSHSAEQKGFVKGLVKWISPFYNVFFDVTRPSLPLGEPLPSHIFHATKTCRLAVVVLSNEFFSSKWPMLELSAFFDAMPSSGVKVLPLFYEISPQDLKNEEKLLEWHKRWEEFASHDRHIKVSMWVHALERLGSINGLIFEKSDGEQAYLDEIVSAIHQMIPPLFRSSHASVHGRERLCKVIVEKFEELEGRPQNPPADLSRVYLLGVYGFPGSGKTTLCACLRDHFFSTFAGRVLHLRMPTNPSPTELLGNAKELLKLTDLRLIKEEMMSEIVNFQQMYDILKASNLQSSRVFLVIDNITSQESIESVEAILRLGVGAGSRVMLVARTLEILRPLLNFAGNLDNHIRYVCGNVRVPSVKEEEAMCILIQSAGCLNLTSDYSQKMKEKFSQSHRAIIAKVARMCTFRDESSSHYGHQDPFYFPMALKIIGSQLGSDGMDLEKWSRHFSQLDTTMVEDMKEGVVRKIVEESYQKLSERLKLLFLDVALLLVPYRRVYVEMMGDFELLGFMHECSPYTIKREVKELRRLCFLEDLFASEFIVHDLFLEFAKSVPDASSMYYCRRRKSASGQVMSDLSMMAYRPRVVLRALILEVDEKCERFDFPMGLSSVKVVVVRGCKSLTILGLVGLTSLVSLEVKGCPRLRHVELDPSHTYTLKSVRWAQGGAYKDTSDEPQQGMFFQKSLLQMLQTGSGMPAKWLINKVWLNMSTLGGWHHRPLLSGFMNLASHLKALQVLRLRETGITSLGDLSSCWQQLRVLEVLEDHLEVLELGNLPKLKQFIYENMRTGEPAPYYSYLPRGTLDPRMLRKPNLLAGCPELEDVRISDPSYEDGMGTLILPPNLRSLSLRNIFQGEPVLPDFTSLAHLLEDIIVYSHWVLESIAFTRPFLSLVQIDLEFCPNLVAVTGLEWLLNLQDLLVTDCAKLQSLGNLEALRMLERLELVDCPVLTLILEAPSSHYLVTMKVWHCPNVQVLASYLESLTAVSNLTCDVSGNMFKLKKLTNLKSLWLDMRWERQVNDPLLLCSYDDEANCEQLNGTIAQVQGMMYVPLLVVGESASAHLSDLTLSFVRDLVSLDGIHRLCSLRLLKLEYLPNLACLQGLESLVNLEDLSIRDCQAVKELPSLCSLVKMKYLSLIQCLNLIALEGLHNMRSLRRAHFLGCENLELRPDELEHLLWHYGGTEVCFKGCKFVSIEAMLGWVLDEKVSKAVLFASLQALTWELSDHLLEKPRERMQLAEQLVETLGVYLTKKPPGLAHGDDCFDFRQWIELLKAAWRDVCQKEGGKAAVSFPRGLRELMEKAGRVPLKEVLQQCQSDAYYRASAANCIIEAHPQVLSSWIRMLVRTFMGHSI